jgi:hypothetical protein
MELLRVCPQQVNSSQPAFACLGACILHPFFFWHVMSRNVDIWYSSWRKITVQGATIPLSFGCVAVCHRKCCPDRRDVSWRFWLLSNSMSGCHSHIPCLCAMVSVEAQYLYLSLGDIDFVEMDIHSHCLGLFIRNCFMVLRYPGVV